MIFLHTTHHYITYTYTARMHPRRPDTDIYGPRRPFEEQLETKKYDIDSAIGGFNYLINTRPDIHDELAGFVTNFTVLKKKKKIKYK